MNKTVGEMTMPTTNWREHIVIDPAIHHGVPCIKGTRVPVSVLVGSIADGDSVDDLLTAYPHLSAEDIHAALKFAAKAVNSTDFILLARGPGSAFKFVDKMVIEGKAVSHDGKVS